MTTRSDVNTAALVRNDIFGDEHLTFEYDEDERDEGETEYEVENSHNPNFLQVELDSEGNPLPKKATIVSCVINLLNTVAGAGMLGLPGAYAGAGYLVGTVLLVVAAFFSALGLRLLAISAATVQSRDTDQTRTRGRDNGNSMEYQKLKTASFYTVAHAALPEFTIFIDAAVALKCFGVATGYFVTVGDCMVDSFHYILRNIPGRDEGGETSMQEIEEAIFTNRDFWIVCALIFVIPISFFKTLDSLKFTSTLSLLLIYGLVVGIVAYAQGMLDPCESPSLAALSDGEYAYEYNEQGSGLGSGDMAMLIREGMIYSSDTDTCRGETELVTDFDSTMKNLAIFVFSFTCHQNVFSIVNELRRPTQRRVDSVIGIAIGCALMLYFTVAVEGYKTYGSEVKGNILLNYPQNGLVTLMRIGITIMVVLSYPLQLDPSRRCLTSLIYAIQDRKEKQRLLEQQQELQDGLEHEGEDESVEESDGDEMFAKLSESSLDRSTSDSSMLDLDDRRRGEDGTDDSLKELIDSFLFYGITCCFLTLSFIIAMTVTDLGVVLGVVGATGSTMVSYILPGAIYIKLHPHDHVLRRLACLQLTLGIIIVPVALYFVLFKGGGG